VEWYEAKDPFNYTILAIHSERAELQYKRIHYSVWAAEDALNRCAFNQSLSFFEKTEFALSSVRSELIPVTSSPQKPPPKKKDNSVEPEPNIEAMVLTNAPKLDDPLWLDAVDVHMTGRLATVYNLVSRRNHELFCWARSKPVLSPGN
jgi:hypothetical protein